MSSERAAAAALVDWINSCPIEPKISSLADLADGSIVAKVLLDIDPSYFKASAANTDDTGTGPDAHWVLRFHRLKRLHKDLTRYYAETLGHRLPSGSPNLTAIAKDGNTEDAIKLVRIIVAAAVQSERREDYIKNIQALSPSSQTEIMGVITQMMELDEGSDPEEEEAAPRAETGDDADHFRLEEEMARLVADKEAVEARNKTLERDFNRLQADFDDNQSLLLNLQDQVNGGTSDKSYANRTDPMLRSQMDQLQSDVQKLEDIIAEKESTIASHERKITTYKRQVEDLHPKAEAGMKYKDDLDEAHHTIERLRKTQNVAEKYRKKLEGMGELERQVKTLEEQNAQMLQDLRAGEDNSKQVPALKRSIDQYKKQIDRLETDYTAAIQAKHMFETEKDLLREKAAGAESQKSHDMERIQALEERIHELESGVISKASGEVSGDLDSELTFTTTTKSDLKLQISRLERELAAAKQGGGSGGDGGDGGDGAGAGNAELQTLLDDAQKAKEKLEHDFIEANTGKLVLESQIAAIKDSTTGESSEVILLLRQSLLDTEKQLADVKRKLADTTAQLDTTNRSLQTAESDLSLVDADKLTALAELKNIANTDLIELQSSHNDLKSALIDSEFELTQKKSLLNTVLLDKDALSQKLSDQKDLLIEKEQAHSDLKTTLAALEGNTTGRDQTLETHATVLQKKLEDRRERLTKSKEHIKKQNLIIRDLQEKLESAMKADENEKLKAAQQKLADVQREKEEELKLLERENALLATAWHDQAARLQMNSVVLSRRGDAPNSWLNKQRNAVYSSLKK